MDLIKLDIAALPEPIFAQMVEIEQNCGICAYPPEVLRECIRFADTYACMDGSTVAGFITLQTYTDYYDEGLHIANINVAQAYRRQGLGRWMIRTACGFYSADHAGQNVTLDVEKTNLPALNLYRKLGFTITDMPSENGPTDWAMTIPLHDLLAGRK